MRRLFILILSLLALLFPVSAAEVDPFVPPSARTAALGGPHAALADDFGLLLANPAGLARAEPELFVSQLAFRASGPLFDMAQAFLGGGDLVQSFIDVLASNDYQLYTGLDMAGPISFGYVGKGIGFGFFNRSIAKVDAAGIASVDITVSEEILLAGGYAFSIPLAERHSLEIGILAKGFVRGSVNKKSNALDLQTIADDPLGQPFSLITGIGVDLGLRWAWAAGLSAGLVCRDLYSPVLITDYPSLSGFLTDPANSSGTRRAEVGRDLSIGLVYKPELRRLRAILDSLMIALDYNDLLDLLSPLSRNPLLNIGLGAEVQLLDILYLRAGIHDALLAAGLGFDLSVFRLNVSAWGKELGLEPGSRPVYNLMVSMEFRY